MKKSFRDWLFEGLNVRKLSNQYLTCERVSDDESKICIKVAPDNIIKTKYGYALILDQTHVVFLKEWAVNDNWYGIEVIMSKQYFNVKEWGVHPDFFPSDGEELTWDYYLNIAKQQNAKDKDNDRINPVKWRI